jgi:CheY-like chemotaxis protein
VAPEGKLVRFTVTDDGPGITPEEAARATEPFFTTKGVGKGTGLGLAMIHGLMTQSGGTLRIRSRVGVGTEVELWLPAAARNQAKAPVDLAQATVGACRPLTILAVDDDELVLLNTVAMLEDLGHTVLQANNGAEALRLLAEAPDLDLLITDHAMPEMTGVELALKAGAVRPDLPVILATGYAEPPSGDGAALARLDKPFGQKQLAAAIDRILLTARG